MEIKLVRKVLEKNENIAHEVRAYLRAHQQSMVNFMSSPGAGKTRLLEALIPLLKKTGLKISVIEGDITHTLDADRLQRFQIPIAQINTEYFGGDCHLAANVVFTALQSIENAPSDLVLLENVGNLVCPAEFDTGAALNIALLSVTEGEDKPLKYPLMFKNSHLVLINKIDLALAAECNVDLMKKNILKVNPKLKVIESSGKTGEGLQTLVQEIVDSRNRFLITKANP